MPNLPAGRGEVGAEPFGLFETLDAGLFGIPSPIPSSFNLLEPSP